MRSRFASRDGMTPARRLGSLALLCALALTLGCRAIEDPEELQGLAGEMPAESSGQPATGAVGGDEVSLDGFPLVGAVFPGLDSRLHSSLCDPASDPYSRCL